MKTWLNEKGVSKEKVLISSSIVLLFNWKKERPSKQKQYKMRLFVFLVAMSLLSSTSLASQTKEEEEETMKIREMTKEVNIQKALFATSLSETEAEIKQFAMEKYSVLNIEEKKLRALERALREEAKGFIARRRLNMDDIIKGAAAIKKRRLNVKDDQTSKQQTEVPNEGDVNDVVIKADKANSFLDTSTKRHGRKLKGWFSEAASSVVDTVSDVASSAVDTVSDVASSAVDTVSDVASSAWDAASDFASDLVGAAGEAWDYMKKLTDLISDGIAGLWDFVKDIFSNMGNILAKMGEILAKFLGESWTWIVKVFKWIRSGAGAIYDFLAYVFGRHCRGSKLCETISDEAICKAEPLQSGECRGASGFDDSDGLCGSMTKDEKKCKANELLYQAKQCKWYEPAAEGKCRWERDIGGILQGMFERTCRAVAFSTCSDGSYKKRHAACRLRIGGINLEQTVTRYDLNVHPGFFGNGEPEDKKQWDSEKNRPIFGPWDETLKPTWIGNVTGNDDKIHGGITEVLWDNDPKRKHLTIGKGPWVYPDQGLGADTCIQCQPGQFLLSPRTPGNEEEAVSILRAGYDRLGNACNEKEEFMQPSKRWHKDDPKQKYERRVGDQCSKSMIKGDYGYIETEQECANAFQTIVDKNKTTDGVKDEEFVLNLIIQEDALRDPSTQSVDATTCINKGSCSISGQSCPSSADEDRENPREMCCNSGKWVVGACSVYAKDYYPRGCSWSKDINNTFVHGIWNAFGVPDYDTDLVFPEYKEGWSPVNKFTNYRTICRNMCAGKLDAPVLTESQKELHKSGEHCVTPIYIVKGAGRELRCTHQVERCTRCKAGQHTGLVYGSTVCKNCTLGKSSGICTTCQGLSWEEGGEDNQTDISLKRAQKNDVIQCYDCPIGTSGGSKTIKKAIYNEYRGDFESYKLYLGYPTFTMTDKQIDDLETEDIVTCEYCPPGRFSDVKGAATCQECPAGYISKYEVDAKGERAPVPRIPECVKCDKGKYAPNAGSFVCTDCELTSYADTKGSTECFLCKPGTYGNAENGGRKCTDCEFGRYAEKAGRVSCTSCAIGKSLIDKKTPCANCAAGRFSIEGTGDFAGTGICVDCPIGYFGEEPSMIACTSCAAIGYINEKRDEFGVTFQTRSTSKNDCVCPPNTFDTATAAPDADGDDGWYAKADFSQSRCETRLRSTDYMVCGLSCSRDIFTLMDALVEQERDFTTGNPNDCPARCEFANTSVATLQVQPGWWRANDESLLFLDCKKDGTQFWIEDCIGQPRPGSNVSNGTSSTTTTGRTGAIVAVVDDDAATTGGGRRRALHEKSVESRRLVNLNNLTKTNLTFGDAMCGPNTRGPLCRSCVKGYSRQGIACKACPSGAQRTLPMSLVIIIMVLMAVFFIVSFRKAWKKELAELSDEDMENDGDLADQKGEIDGHIGLAKDLKGEAQKLAKSSGADKLKEKGQALKQVGSASAERVHKSGKAITGAAITGAKTVNAVFFDDGGNSKSNPLAKIKTTTKQLLTFMQISCSFTITFDQIEWPLSFQKISLSGSFANLDFIGYFQGIDAPEYCSLTMPFLEMFWWHMLLVPILLGVLLTLFILNRLFRLTGNTAKKKLGRIANENTFWNLLNVTLFMLYPGLAQRIFEVYKCTTIHKVPYVRVSLVKDMEVECHVSEHAFYVAMATLFLGLYVIGIPAFMFYVLFSNRKDIKDENSPKHVSLSKRFGSLYAHYENEWYFWELIETGRKALLTGALVVIAPGTSTQIFFGIFLVIAHMLLTLKASPYYEDADDLLAFCSCLCLLLTLLMGLFLKVQGDDTTEEGKVLAGIMMTFMYVSVLLLGFFSMAMAIPCCRRKCFKEKDETKEDEKKKKSTKVVPLSQNEREKGLNEMKAARLKYGAGSKEYKAAAKKYQNTGGKTKNSKPKKLIINKKPIPKKKPTPSSNQRKSNQRGQKKNNTSRSPSRVRNF